MGYWEEYREITDAYDRVTTAWHTEYPGTSTGAIGFDRETKTAYMTALPIEEAKRVSHPSDQIHRRTGLYVQHTRLDFEVGSPVYEALAEVESLYLEKELRDAAKAARSKK